MDTLVDIPPGWVGLYSELLAALDAHPDVTVRSVAPRLGAMRAVLRGQVPASVRDLLVRLEVASTRTCQQCGKPGKHGRRDTQWVTRCERC